MEKALEIFKKEYPLICDMSFEWGWKSCEETMNPKTCEGCKYQKTDIDRCDFCKRYYSDQYEPKDNA